MDRYTINAEARLITVHTDELDGYPHADASAWADLKRDFMRAAQSLADQTGEAVEVQDDDGSLLEHVEAQS